MTQNNLYNNRSNDRDISRDISRDRNKDRNKDRSSKDNSSTYGSVYNSSNNLSSSNNSSNISSNTTNTTTNNTLTPTTNTNTNNNTTNTTNFFTVKDNNITIKTNSPYPPLNDFNNDTEIVTKALSRSKRGMSSNNNGFSSSSISNNSTTSTTTNTTLNTNTTNTLNTNTLTTTLMPTTVQKFSIPPILNKRNVLIRAPTGMGKTLAFLYPLIKNIKRKRDAQIVVIVPTRELAEQVNSVCINMIDGFIREGDSSNKGMSNTNNNNNSNILKNPFFSNIRNPFLKGNNKGGSSSIGNSNKGIGSSTTIGSNTNTTNTTTNTLNTNTTNTNIYSIIKSIAVTGKSSYLKSYEEFDIIVATPGRLLDLLERKMISMEKTETLVLDEADELLNLGFNKTLNNIREYIKSDSKSDSGMGSGLGSSSNIVNNTTMRNTNTIGTTIGNTTIPNPNTTNTFHCILVSATYNKSLFDIINKFLTADRVVVEVQNEMGTNIEQRFMRSSSREKFSKMMEYIERECRFDNKWSSKVEADKVLVFVHMKKTCVRLVRDMEMWYKSIGSNSNSGSSNKGDSISSSNSGIGSSNSGIGSSTTMNNTIGNTTNLSNTTNSLNNSPTTNPNTINTTTISNTNATIPMISFINGDLDQKQRQMEIFRFRNGTTNILVASSLAARGIDVKDIKLVVNYDTPRSVTEYIHRVGRTGRENKMGVSLTMIDENTSSNFIEEVIELLEGSGNKVPESLLSSRSNRSNRMSGSSRRDRRDIDSNASRRDSDKSNSRDSSRREDRFKKYNTTTNNTTNTNNTNTNNINNVKNKLEFEEKEDDEEDIAGGEW